MTLMALPLVSMVLFVFQHFMTSLGEWLWQPLQNASYIYHLAKISVKWLWFGGEGVVWLANVHYVL